MSVATSLKTSQYYDYYRDKEVIFSKANIKYLKLDPREIYLKCNGGHWPCIINSSSLQQAKIIVGTSCGIFDILRKKKDVNVSLRYGFFEQNEKFQFFVTCNVINIEKYQDKNDLALITLAFNQRPPDDLILKLGEFVEVNENFKFQNKQKILITKENIRLLSIPKEETYVYIQNVPRKCILKDISFGGVTLLLVGIPKFLEKKEVELRLLFSDTNEQVALKGIIESAEFMPGRKDISVVEVVYIQEQVPMNYKFHINNYLTSSSKKRIQKQNENKDAEGDTTNNIFGKMIKNEGVVQKTVEAAEKIAEKVTEKLTEKVEKVSEIVHKKIEQVSEKKQETKNENDNQKTEEK